MFSVGEAGVNGSGRIWNEKKGRERGLWGEIEGKIQVEDRER